MSMYISNIEQGETRRFAAHGQAQLATAGGLTILKGMFEPGWRWSTDIAPIAGTPSCETHHLGYVIRGEMTARMDDGTELTFGPGDLFDLPAGHDAWVVGDEPCEILDYSSDATRYARPNAASPPDDKYMTLVRRGYEAFNNRDLVMLRQILAHDVAQHVPGSSPLAGAYKGIEAVLGYYGKLAELTDDTFRADLIGVAGDGQGHVTAVHQISATRGGVTRVSRGTILFTFLGDRVTDLLEMREDLAGDDAFMS